MDYWEGLSHLNLYSLQRRRERYMIIYVWKILNALTPNDIEMEFYDHVRHGCKVKIPPVSKKCSVTISSIYDSSFPVVAAKLWNVLPKEVNQLTELAPFKAAIKRFLRYIPDKPPTQGYSTVNSNSLLDWSTQPGGLQNVRWPC